MKTIIIDSGKTNEFIHLVDLKEFGIPHILSSYIGVFDGNIIIMDTGSSNDALKIIGYMKKNHLPLEKVSYLLTSHHHFDHNGGIWKLYDLVKKYNPGVKILTNKKTKALLNDYEFHLARGKRTYGDLVGTMRKIPNKAFELITPSRTFTKDLDSLEYMKEFKLNGEKVKMVILSTPGHTPDHQSIAFVKGDEIEFIFLGEAVGTLYHSKELITSPTSMPIFFNYGTYMNSLSNLKRLKTPFQCGFGHHGVINGKECVRRVLEEHGDFMKDFRSKVVYYYKESPKTKYVFEKIKPFFQDRYKINRAGESIFDNIILGLTYGMMMSLGYRNPSERESEIIEQYT